MKSLPVILLSSSLAILALGASPAPQEDEDGVTKTRFGNVAITTDESDALIHRVAFNGKEILKYEGYSVNIETVLPSGDIDYALVAENSGGSACPMMFVLVQLKAKKTPVLSEEFGTCSDLIKAQIVNGTFVAELPNYVAHPDLWDQNDLKDAARSKMVYTWSQLKITKKKVRK